MISLLISIPLIIFAYGLGRRHQGIKLRRDIRKLEGELRTVYSALRAKVERLEVIDHLYHCAGLEVYRG